MWCQSSVDQFCSTISASLSTAEKMNDTYVVKQKQKKHMLSASSCCIKNMKYRLRLREMHTLSSSRTFQSWTWRSKFKSDLAEMCSHSKKLSRSWTALVKVVSVPDDAEYSQRFTWFWLVAVVFIFILTELTDDVGALNRRESCLTHYKYSPKGLFRISSICGKLKKIPPLRGGILTHHSGGISPRSGAIKAVFGGRTYTKYVDQREVFKNLLKTSC